MKKDDLLLIFFTKSLVLQHTPKIIDQTEISDTLRAHKNMIVADIAKSFQKSIKLDDIFGFLLKYPVEYFYRRGVWQKFLSDQ